MSGGIAMLRCDRINTYYGPAHVLFDVSLEVPEGKLVALVGRNGVGKSTTLKTIMGLAPSRSGAVFFKNDPIHELQPFQTASLGVGYVPEDRRVFAELTVEENLEVAERSGEWTRARVFKEFPLLAQLRKRRAGLLSGGQQQMLTIARCLVTNPDLLLIDEPTEGLAPIVIADLELAIKGLMRDGRTCLLAAQDLGFVLSVADEILVMDKGRVTYRTTADEARSNPAELARHTSV